jgi:hypothetical protein
MLVAYDATVGVERVGLCRRLARQGARWRGERTGKTPVDQGQLGQNWSIDTDQNGIPIVWIAEAANHNDSIPLPRTLDEVAARDDRRD